MTGRPAPPLDQYEKRILRLLQEDASLSNAEIAEQVGLSASPCWRRIDRLEREGFIKRRVAILDRRKAAIVCGAANNVLASDADGVRLAARGVLYCPDYVVNSGGIINVCAEHLGWSLAEVERRVGATGERLRAVLDHAAVHAMPPHRAADALAQALISGHGVRSAQAA